MSAQMEKETSSTKTRSAAVKARRASVLSDASPLNAAQFQQQPCVLLAKKDVVAQNAELTETEFTSEPPQVSASCPVQIPLNVSLKRSTSDPLQETIPLQIPTSTITKENISSTETSSSNNLELESLDCGSQSYSPAKIYIPSPSNRPVEFQPHIASQTHIEPQTHIKSQTHFEHQTHVQSHIHLPIDSQINFPESQTSHQTLSQASNQILSQVSNQILSQVSNQIFSQTSTQSISQVEEEPVNFQDINLLMGTPGITQTDIENLKRVGIMTIRGAQTALRRFEIEGMDENKVDILRQVCSRITSEQGVVAEDGFLTARKVNEQRKSSVFRIGTGSENLDKLSGGGIEASSVTEVFGESGSGKTQLCHTLCVMAQLPSNVVRRRDSSRENSRKRSRGGCNYFGGKVIFLDTENTFRPERLNAIADRFDLDRAQVLDNILYARALNSLHQYELLNNVVSRLHAEPGVYKLLIVDSVVALFRADYASGNSGGVTKRQHRLFRMMTRLKEIAEEYNIAVLVTNHVTTDMTSTGGGDQYKPAGGNALAHAVTTRLCLQKTRTNEGLRVTRKAMMFGSPVLEDAEVEFVIGAGGIQDVD